MAKKVFSGSVCNVKTTNQTRNFDLVMDSDLNFKSHSKTIEVWIFTDASSEKWPEVTLSLVLSSLC